MVFFLLIGNVVFLQSYSFQHLSIDKGLPQSQAFAIIFDSNQYAWIGTQGGGLARYDGDDFKVITKSDSLISNRIYSLQQIKNEIWVGQKGGITVFNIDGAFLRNYRLLNYSMQVNDIISFNDAIYLATDSGPMILDSGQFVFYKENITLVETNVYEFFINDENQLWLCTNKGLLSFDDPINKLSMAKGLSVSEVSCAILVDSIWILGTVGGGINLYHKGGGMIYQPEALNELDDMIILSLFYAGTGELWIGTMNHGVYVYSKSNNSLKNFQSNNGLANNHVRTIVADRWENIWLGTSGGGISIYQNSPFIEYNTLSGLNGNYVYSVLNDRSNNIWVGTEGTGIIRINDTSNVLFDEDYGFSSAKVKAIFEDNAGDIWIGTDGEGLGIFSQYDAKDTIYAFDRSNGIYSNWIKCFAQNPDTKEIYIGTFGSGILRIKKDWKFPLEMNVVKLKVDGGDLPDDITSLSFIDNKLWFTSRDGFYGYVKNGKLKKVTNLNEDFGTLVGNGNNIWIGTADNGILQLTLESDSIVNEVWITTNDKLSSNNIYQLLLNEEELWVGSPEGLDRVTFDSIFTPQIPEHYGFEEGFEGKETNLNAASKDRDGNMWFGTVNGLYAYKGGEVNYAQRKPPVLSMSDFSIFYESIKNTEYEEYYNNGKMIKKLVLPYDKNNIGFSFKAIHYTYSNKIRYKWKLIGAEKDWSPASELTTAFYSNLTPGDYKFQVKASIDDDDWNIEPLEITFSIDTPYWEKWWFKLSYYGLIGFIVILIVLIVVFRYRRKNRILKEKFQMEKNLLELEQKALRLQMNPHFIFNVLTSIHNLIILNDSDKARYALAKFSKLMRRVLENSREKFISIDDEVETLENYVQLEKLTSNLDVQLEIIIDESIDSAEEILPPLMIQPFVENAIIHGLKELDKQGRITVSFKMLNEHLLECSIEDNGRGRQKAFEIIAQKENYHKSTALKVTQERLANLNKRTSFIPFEILDIKDKSGNPCGTKIILRIEV